MSIVFLTSFVLSFLFVLILKNDGQISLFFVCEEEGKLMFCGSDIYNLGIGEVGDLVTIMESKQIKKIVCGFEHILILKSNGEIHSCGNQRVNGSGEDRKGLHLIMKDKKIKDVFCGSYFSFVLMKNGDVVGFGENDEGSFSSTSIFWQVNHKITLKKKDNLE